MSQHLDGLFSKPSRWPDARIRIGVSSCLLGERVRWDGRHKQDDWIVERLARWVDLVPFCPEFEAGMGIPREPVRLVSVGSEIRMISVHTRRDWTTVMRRTARLRIRQLERLDLSGYVLKKDSPSCGLERVPVQRLVGTPPRRASGLFARELTRTMPHLPVQEEGALRDPRRREHFLEQVFAQARLRRLMQSGCSSLDDLVGFHGAHEVLLLSHSPRRTRELARLLDHAPPRRIEPLAERYAEEFMATLRIRPTVAGHVNALRHAAGLLKGRLRADERRELEKSLSDYRRHRVARGVPLALLRGFLARARNPYLRRQIYLRPFPDGLLDVG